MRTHDALEREEMNKYAHEFDVHYSVIDSFFKAQQEGKFTCLISKQSVKRNTKKV